MAQLLYLEGQDPDKDISLYINSPGGSISAGMAIHDTCLLYTSTWLQTFADLGIDPAFYCQRPIGLDEVTPWSHMDYGVTHEYLVREYKKALAAQTTQPCNRACHGCGANHLLGGPCFDYSQNLV